MQQLTEIVLYNPMLSFMLACFILGMVYSLIFEKDQTKKVNDECDEYDEAEQRKYERWKAERHKADQKRKDDQQREAEQRRLDDEQQREEERRRAEERQHEINAAIYCSQNRR